MENLSMCRICLATDIRMCSVASHLRDMFERITDMTFKRENWRPLVACYICYARLQYCYRLRTSCLRSEELFTDMVSSGVLPQDVLNTNSFRVVSVTHFSIGHVLRETTECHIKEEPPEITSDVEFDYYTKDIKIEPQEEQIDIDIQCSQLEDPLENEHDDVDTDCEEIKLEIEETNFEENETNESLQSVDNICPKIVKVVLEKLILNDTIPATGVHALKQTEETDSLAVAETENINVFGKRLAKSNKKIHKHRDNKVRAHDEDHKQISNSNICSIEKCFRSKADLESDTCSEHDLTQHMYTHTDNKPLTNEYCKKQSPRKSQSTVSHEDELVKPTDAKPFRCETCKKCFIKECHLKQHQKYGHSGKKLFQCHICYEIFTFKCNLTRHIHRHATEKIFDSDICNKSFTNKYNLSRHKSTHYRDKRYECETCNKSFVNKSNLTQHQYIHTGEKRFRCDTCNKCFSTKFNLTQHVYTHTGEKQFYCDLCNISFIHKSNLTQHMLWHANDKRYQCNICDKRFIYKYYLKYHLKTHTSVKNE